MSSAAADYYYFIVNQSPFLKLLLNTLFNKMSNYCGKETLVTHSHHAPETETAALDAAVAPSQGSPRPIE